MSLSMFVPSVISDAWKQVDNAVTAAVKFAKGLNEYEVVIQTGDKRAAGTDANVFLTMEGWPLSDQNTFPRQKLSAKFRNLFERGQKDTFKFECANLGELKKVTIEHDGTGIGSGWYVDSVTVRNLRNGKLWTFPCDDWLEQKGEQKAIKELVPI